MFKRKTLFILGAGASYPYEYPLGTGLVQDIIHNIEYDNIYLPLFDQSDPLKNVSDYSFKNYLHLLKEESPLFPGPYEISNQGKTSNYSYFPISNLFACKLNLIVELQELSQRLKDFSPISIDAFLRDNQKFSDAGRIIIAYSLFKKEKEFSSIQQKAGDWYSYFFNDLVAQCENPDDIMKNNIDIITFNYDVSLECYLYQRLQKTEFFSNIAEDFLTKFINTKIHHVYGELYKSDNFKNYAQHNIINHPSPEELNTRDKNSVAFKMAINNYAFINTMRHEIAADKKLKKLIAKAEDIIIIGFGFDRDNLTKIGFPLEIKGYEKLKGKTIKYLDYGGKMNSLHAQFQAIKDKHNDASLSINIIRSPATNIIDAYENDFKLRLF